MAKTYKVQSTISTSNASVQIKKGGETHNIEMNVSLTASVVKLKTSIFCLGRMFPHEITVGAQGSGQISVFEMYQLFGNSLKDLLATGNDSKISIICTAKSDDNEYNERKVVLQHVVFDTEVLFNIDDQNISNIKAIPFTFEGIDFQQDFSRK